MYIGRYARGDINVLVVLVGGREAMAYIGELIRD